MREHEMILRNLDAKLDVIGRLWARPGFAGDINGRTYVIADFFHDALEAAQAINLNGEAYKQLHKGLFERLNDFRRYVNEVEIMNAIEQMESGVSLDDIVWNSKPVYGWTGTEGQS